MVYRVMECLGEGIIVGKGLFFKNNGNFSF